MSKIDGNEKGDPICAKERWDSIYMASMMGDTNG